MATPSRRRGLSALAAATLTFTAWIAAPALSHADDPYTGESYCGVVYSGSTIAENWYEAFRDMKDDFYDDLFEQAGGPKMLCGTYHWLIEQGAQWVVSTHAPDWYDTLVYLANTSDASESGTGLGTPNEIPAVGPTTYPVSWTGDGFLWLRGGPGWGASLMAKIPEGTQLAIICQTHGQWIQSPMAATTLWDKVEYNGQIGFVSDAFVFTRSDEMVAPAC